MDKETEKKIEQLQSFEQSSQNIVMQKQQFQSQLLEIESALKGLDDSENAYKIVGNIMISAKKEDLKKELNEKKEVTELRIKTIEKQEEQIKKKSGELQKEVMSVLEKEKNESGNK